MPKQKYTTLDERLAAMRASREKWRLKKQTERRASREIKKPPTKTQLLLRSAKTRAKKTGKDFDITLDDIIIPEYCPILGIKIENGIGLASPNSPSLDRRDSSKGYIKGNVEVISWRANKLKSNATLEELRQICDWLADSP